MEFGIGLAFLAILYVLNEIRKHQKEDRARKSYEEYQKKNPPFDGTPEQRADLIKWQQDHVAKLKSKKT
jgi:hypothetical protein